MGHRKQILAAAAFAIVLAGCASLRSGTRTSEGPLGPLAPPLPGLMRERIIGASYVQPPIPVPEFRFTDDVVLRRSTNLVDWHELRIVNTARVDLLYRDLESNQAARFFFVR